MERRTTPRAPEHVSDDDRTSEARRSSSPALPGSSRQEPSAAARALYSDARVREEAGYFLAMLRLPVPAVGETRELACAVCLDDFQAGDRLRRMPCSHSFHQRCIFPWLRIRPHCPYCRYALPAADLQCLLDQMEGRTVQLTTHDFFLLK